MIMCLITSQQRSGPNTPQELFTVSWSHKYEIPVDSRITNWLKDFGFPVALSAAGLQDRAYYHFVSDGIQRLCDEAGIYPCVLDAAIFSSYDSGGWNVENIVY